jgi:hypothetical protein
MVEAADVRQLLQRKLMPLGLIATPAGEMSTTQESEGYQPRIFAAALRLRMQTLSPRVIEPFTGCYKSATSRSFSLACGGGGTLPLVAVSRAGHHQKVSKRTLYARRLLLTLVIVCLAGMFHELGHAAALRYGGGKVRGMGSASTSCTPSSIRCH